MLALFIFVAAIIIICFASGYMTCEAEHKREEEKIEKELARHRHHNERVR